MTLAPRRTTYLLLSLLLTVGCWAQNDSDALSPDEIDQIRDAAQSPAERLKLYINFARLRLDAAERLRADPKAKNPSAEIHDQLQEFLSIYDELNENIETYADRNDDLRKALKNVIDADTEFQNKLRALEDSSMGTPQEKSAYQFQLTNSLEDVDDGAHDHRQLLAEQEEAAKHKKKKEKATGS